MNFISKTKYVYANTVCKEPQINNNMDLYLGCPSRCFKRFELHSTIMFFNVVEKSFAIKGQLPLIIYSMIL